MKSSPRAEALLARVDVDLARRQPMPRPGRVAAATAAALGVSLGVDAAIVALGTRLFPATRHFSHFRFSDYATLTTLGVLAAALGWPLLVRVAGSPRRLYRQAAVLVTLVLLLPDLYILAKGEPSRAVAVLVVMHLAIALCTYHLVVRVAPAPAATAIAPDTAVPPAGAGEPRPLADTAPAPGAGAGEGVVRRWWFVTLGSLSSLELVAGLVALLAVPYGRPSEVLVHGRGGAVYLLHAALGAVLALGALALVPACRRAPRPWRGAAIAGLVGLLIGGIGGALVVDRPARLIGVGLMLVGAVLAPSAYFLPMLSEHEPVPDPLDEAPGPAGVGAPR